MTFSYWQIKANALLRLYLNDKKDYAGINLFFYIINNGIFDLWVYIH